MKTTNLLKSVMVAFFLLSGITMNAQKVNYYNTKHEVAFSVGVGPNTQIINDIADFETSLASAVVTSVFTGGQIIGSTSYENKTLTPAFSVEYYYHVNKLIGIGAIAGFNGEKTDIFGSLQFPSGDTYKGKIGEAKRASFTIMPAAKFDWLRKKNVGLYSKVALGASIMHEKQTLESEDNEAEVDNYTRVIANFHCSLLGVEVGSEKVRGFAEFGMGEQGILLAGIRCKF